MRTLLLFIIVVSFLPQSLRGEKPVNDSQADAEAKAAVESTRGVSMYASRLVKSDGSFDPIETRREKVIGTLRALGKKSVPSLIAALSDPDVLMRKNAELIMISLAGTWDGQPRVDINEAIPALIKATTDQDSDVRAWAAHALAEIGPDAKQAVPALIILIRDPQEGPRNTSCLALGNIGPQAKEALPALHEALKDPSPDVKRFARKAIDKIQPQPVGHANP